MVIASFFFSSYITPQKVRSVVHLYDADRWRVITENGRWVGRFPVDPRGQEMTVGMESSV